MYEFEFEKVMKVMGLKPIRKSEGVDLKEHDVYECCGLDILYGGNYYASVHGKIPFEVVKTIYNKYPENQHGIRIEGGVEKNKPDDYAQDDALKNEISEIYNQDHLSCWDIESLVKQAKEKVKERSDKDKYITFYHIDTKEGLLIFITELKDYWLRQAQREETEVKKYNEYLSAVVSSMLEDINPAISAYEWMQGDDKYCNLFSKTLERDYSTVLNAAFRNRIFEFDKAVNPFLDNTIRLGKVSNYIDKVSITGYVSDGKFGDHRDNCCTLIISDLSSKNTETSYYRDPNGFKFGVCYGLGGHSFIAISHEFSMNGRNEEDRGERISIKTDNVPSEETIDIEFNVTNGTIGTAYGEKRIATTKEISKVYEYLENAIDYAANITLSNMKLKPEDELTLKNMK